MRLYRGIAVPSADHDRVVAEISARGLVESKEANWTMSYPDLRPRLSELFDKSDLSTEDTRPSRTVMHPGGQQVHLIGALPAVCACGDLLGACYYANHHNRTPQNDSPIVISFEVEESDLVVDGKDFLYTLFQLGQSPRQRQALIDVFGDRIRAYVDRAWASSDQDYRIAICDLAVQDPEIVSFHHANGIVLGGRHGTTFKSAFLARLPVPPDRLTILPSATCKEPYEPGLELSDLLRP